MKTKQCEHSLRLIPFSLAGFNTFLSCSRFILVVVLFQELAVFFPQITVFFSYYGFGTMSRKFDDLAFTWVVKLLSLLAVQVEL